MGCFVLDPDHMPWPQSDSTKSHEMYGVVVKSLGLRESYKARLSEKRRAASVLKGWTGWATMEIRLQGRICFSSCWECCQHLAFSCCRGCAPGREPSHPMSHPFWNGWHPVTSKGMTGGARHSQGYLKRLWQPWNIATSYPPGERSLGAPLTSRCRCIPASKILSSRPTVNSQDHFQILFNAQAKILIELIMFIQ